MELSRFEMFKDAKSSAFSMAPQFLHILRKGIMLCLFYQLIAAATSPVVFNHVRAISLKALFEKKSGSFLQM